MSETPQSEQSAAVQTAQIERTHAEASQTEADQRLPLRPETAPKFAPRALRDSLTTAQTRARGAAHLSGERLSGLLYGPGAVEAHRAPYNQRYAPNYHEATREETAKPGR
ncbi:MAG TPA: hypothetical protein VLJ14_15350 [Ktedonobacterales bacterium]|jgi:hypothetical protein|nr:hypothetical protein [Ktedonobacterales bacterium]